MTEYIPKLASKLAQAIRRNHKDAASEDVLKFALVVIINTFSVIFAVLLICALTGHLREGTLALFFFALLRYVSGGVHLHSSDACTLISIIIMALLAHFSLPYLGYGLVINITTLIIIISLAPKGIEEVRKLKPSHVILYKWLAILLVASNFYFQSSLLAATFFVQALTLTPPLYILVKKLERRSDT